MEKGPCGFLNAKYENDSQGNKDLISAKCDILATDLGIENGKPVRSYSCQFIANEADLNCNLLVRISDYRLSEIEYIIKGLQNDD